MMEEHLRDALLQHSSTPTLWSCCDAPSTPDTSTPDTRHSRMPASTSIRFANGWHLPAVRLTGVVSRNWPDSEEFHKFLEQEFPQQAAGWFDGVSRRDFLKLMGASLALAGLNACRATPLDEKIVPYVNQPEEIVPGRPLFFATAFPMRGVGAGVLVESHEGRPTKIEGNPNHPASLGATDAFAQASILTLYDPDRSQVVKNAGRISTWSAFFTAVNDDLEAERVVGGGGLRILTETITSPALGNQLRQLLARFPNAKWHQYEPVNLDNVHAGARLAFGAVVDTIYRLENAEVILSLDADFLFSGPANVRYAREFAAKRRVRQGKIAMNRLYAIEATPSVTGAMADHRIALRPSEIPNFAAAVAAKMGLSVQSTTYAQKSQWIDALVRDLQTHRGASVVIAGDQQPPGVHALAHAMNQALDNVGKTVVYTDPIEAHSVDQMASLRDLVKDMESGSVRVLIMLSGNPVYTAPVDLGFAEQLAKVPLRVHSGLYEDETSAYCHWHLPETHYLESWSDIRAYDGTATILQPLIAPLYSGKSAHEILSAVAGKSGETSYDIVRNYWKGQKMAGDFESAWRRAVHDGVVAGTNFPPKAVNLKAPTNEWLARPPSVSETRNQKPETQNPQSEPGSSLEISFQPDPTLFDGRFANMVGCRSCRSLSRSLPGTTPRSSVQKPPSGSDCLIGSALGAVNTAGYLLMSSKSATKGAACELRLGSSPVMPTSALPCISATAAPGRAKSVTAPASMPTRFKPQTHPAMASKRKFAESARNLPWLARSSITAWKGAIWCAPPR